jgi:hypothetical protein
LREEHRLRVFENRVLRKIFGPKREEDGSWRKLHNDEQCDTTAPSGRELYPALQAASPETFGYTFVQNPGRPHRVL